MTIHSTKCPLKGHFLKGNIMKNKIIIVSAILLITVSLCFFLYPPISKEVVRRKNQELYDEFISHRNDVVDSITKEYASDETITNDNTDSELTVSTVSYTIDLESLYNSSVSYNESLKDHQQVGKFDLSPFDLTDYGIYNGIYAVISIPAANINLPIYLGANNNNMAYGATHLYSTSLPLGGKDSNCVICGHTGFLGKTFFDNLDSLSEGDEIFITTFWEDLKYTVSYGQTISCDQVEPCYIQKGKDLLTLITCANYGTDRYIVVAERSESNE